jgi:sugar/nucleoside kinase (ribokinase family)
MGQAVEISGGSAANTAAGIASFGGEVGFVGKVGADQLGEVFTHDIGAVGVDYQPVTAGEGGSPTARCLILVTPDAQRTMNTFLGASAEVHPDDVDVDRVRRAGVLYCEGYLWDPPEAKAAMRKAMDAAVDAGVKVAFTLSDSFCVDRHRAEFLELLDGPVDILFANEAEVLSLYEAPTWEVAVERVRGHVDIACLTRSEKGSHIIHGHDEIVIPAHPVDDLVDTTGAGDLYASGFLYGYTHNLDLKVCGDLASLAAAEVISHVGARPERPLAELARAAGILD